MTDRLYEPLNGAEMSKLATSLLGELGQQLSAHAHMREHVTWPRGTITVRVTVESLESQPRVDLTLAQGPITAPDTMRERLGLEVPVVVAVPSGKRETRVSAGAVGRTSKSSAQHAGSSGKDSGKD